MCRCFQFPSIPDKHFENKKSIKFKISKKKYCKYDRNRAINAGNAISAKK